VLGFNPWKSSHQAQAQTKPWDSTQRWRSPQQISTSRHELCSIMEFNQYSPKPQIVNSYKGEQYMVHPFWSTHKTIQLMSSNNCTFWPRKIHCVSPILQVILVPLQQLIFVAELSQYSCQITELSHLSP
jgi:hypothetical protein